MSKHWLRLGLAGLFALAVAGQAEANSAIPNLQLDIAGGTYDYATNTIIAPGNSFTLYTYLYRPTQTDVVNLPLDRAYFISAALVPQTTNPNQGTFAFNSPYFNTIYNGTNFNNTVNFATDIYADYGNPPHYEANQSYDTGDLLPHGIFDTYFKEFKFVFSEGRQISAYDTAARAKTGGSIPTTGSGMYWASFQVDTSQLLPGNAIHFDIYTLYIDPVYGQSVDYYAPFSYDAQSLDPPNGVPEPSTIMLFGSGLMGLGLWGRRKFRAAHRLVPAAS